MRIANRRVLVTGFLAALSTFALLGGNSAVGQDARKCVKVEYTGAGPLTSFKARIYNTCNKTIWVSFCEQRQCGRSRGYYNSAQIIGPGEYKPIDSEGDGVSWAACVYEAPDHDTPQSNNNGDYHCD